MKPMESGMKPFEHVGQGCHQNPIKDDVAPVKGNGLGQGSGWKEFESGWKITSAEDSIRVRFSFVMSYRYSSFSF
jgi:hypothetical protein